MADLAPVRVRGPRQVRDDEAAPGGRGADLHRPVQVPLLRPRGGHDGVNVETDSNSRGANRILLVIVSINN